MLGACLALLGQGAYPANAWIRLYPNFPDSPQHSSLVRLLLSSFWISNGPPQKRQRQTLAWLPRSLRRKRREIHRSQVCPALQDLLAPQSWCYYSKQNTTPTQKVSVSKPYDVELVVVGVVDTTSEDGSDCEDSEESASEADISSNWLVGLFPNSALSLPTLVYLDVSENKFTGKLLKNMSCVRLWLWGLISLEKRVKGPYEKLAVVIRSPGGVVGLMGFLFVKRRHQPVNKAPHTRFIADKVSPGYTLQLLRDYGMKIVVVTSFKDNCYIEILLKDQQTKRVIYLSFSAEVSAYILIVRLISSVSGASFYNCRFYGYQDTICDDKGKHLFKDCYIKGTFDFIFGSSKSLCLNSEIHVIPGDPMAMITVQARSNKEEDTGYIFVHCKVTGSGGTTYLVRSWFPSPQVVFAFLNCAMLFIPKDGPIINNPAPIAFTKNYNLTIYFGEYNNRGPGENWEKRVPFAKKLSAADVKPFLSLAFVEGYDILLNFRTCSEAHAGDSTPDEKPIVELVKVTDELKSFKAFDKLHLERTMLVTLVLRPT
ncbi:pectinesterase 2 [Phtheirospermum japonicum]|uniref:pectinesterase n=1 Tax=Phtheirospermum japonicum TaxID=374723 RepID=A0A830BUB6_9LAMI|nr:pectinesterase 2 [Phtheirospermum japonicum]